MKAGKEPSGNFPQGIAEAGRAKDIAAAGVGMLRAERKCGELLAKMGEKRGQPAKVKAQTAPLLSAGVTRMESQKFQAGARLPAAEFEGEPLDGRPQSK